MNKIIRASHKKKFIDLFCGLGAFRIGLEKNNFECVFSLDNNKNVQKVYQENFTENPYGDITKIDPSELPNFDVLTAGFPCQPFSISGKNLGFKDTRGTLFFNICKIIRAKNPSVVLLENVKNIIYHDKKRTLSVILNSLVELGYNVDWRVLNLTNFGLPQNRARIIIIGSKNKSFDFDKLRTKKSKSLEHFLDQNGEFDYLDQSEYTLLDPKIVRNQYNSGLIFVGYRNKAGFKRGIRPNTEHLNRVHRQPNRIYSVKGYHPTIPSQEPSGRFFIYLPKENRVRKLTLNECYRIMGFPETYKKSLTRGIHTVQIGNSCGITLIEELSYQFEEQGLFNDGNAQAEVIGNNFSVREINKQTVIQFP